MTVTEKLAREILLTRFEGLLPEVVEMARLVMLDGLAVTIAGCHEPSPRLVAEHVQEMGGRQLCSVVGHGFRTSPVQAAYINGVSCHALDFEPMWDPPTHPTSPTLPVALALGEWMELDGKTLIVGLVTGFEVQGRIRLATAHLNPGDLTLHPPGTVGVMGAAATAACMLELDEQQTCMALGIAASRASALMANVGYMTKSNHCGNAARLGLEASLLARKGYSAHPDILAAPLGYAEAIFAGQLDIDAVVNDFGQPYRMVKPGLIFKRYPCQIATQFGIEAALELHHTHGVREATDITAVTVTTPVMRYVDRSMPASGLDGKSSFQYTAAVALLDGIVNIDSFSDARLHAYDMQALLPRVRLVQDPTIPGSLGQMSVTVRVEMQGGQVLEAHCRRPRESDHIAKARDCMERQIAPPQAARVISMVRELERLNGSGVRDLLRLT